MPPQRTDRNLRVPLLKSVNHLGGDSVRRMWVDRRQTHYWLWGVFIALTACRSAPQNPEDRYYCNEPPPQDAFAVSTGAQGGASGSGGSNTTGGANNGGSTNTGGSSSAECNVGFDDCDGDATNGCETDLSTSSANCGRCGRSCDKPNATGQCTDGQCNTTLSCDAGFGDCDGNLSNGCEAETALDPANCGSCGHTCTADNATSSCAGGQCEFACAEGFDDCDNNAQNGCEHDVSSDVNNCGACGVQCAVTCAFNLCTEVSSLDVGFDTLCLHTANNARFCQGSNDFSQLDKDAGATEASLIQVEERLGAITAVGRKDLCWVAIDDALYCRGENLNGWLTNGVTGALLSPTPIAPVGSLSTLSMSATFACGLNAGATGVACLGTNTFGELGIGSLSAQEALSALNFAATPMISVATGGAHACATLATGELICWGKSNDGQLGITIANNEEPSPVFVQDSTSGMNLAGVTQVSLGFAHSCAVVNPGKVLCWGLDNSGQVSGIPSPLVEQAVDAALGDLLGSTWVEVAAGAKHSCARRDDGAVVCWGDNTAGQLGDGGMIQGSGLTGVILTNAVSLKSYPYRDRTCAILSDGNAQCWGNGVLVPTTIPW